MKREERERRRIYVSEWMVVKGGGVAGHEEAEDKQSEAKVWKEEWEVSAGVKRAELHRIYRWETAAKNWFEAKKMVRQN